MIWILSIAHAEVGEFDKAVANPPFKVLPVRISEPGAVRMVSVFSYKHFGKPVLVVVHPLAFVGIGQAKPPCNSDAKKWALREVVWVKFTVLGARR
jgi:hypothetical protein